MHTHTRPLIYQMLPRLWGEGRFGSVDDASMRYFKSLGVTHVWYTGVIRHSTGQPFVKGDPGSPYAISDYYDVNPYLAYHQSNRIDEFKNLVKRTHKHGLGVIIDFVPNHVGRDYADSRRGVPHHDHCDYDWTDTYKIDYNHPDTWSIMKDIVMHWASMGVDGFRCDMVEMVPPEFFQWLIAEIKSVYPDLIFIAEVYQKERYWQYVKQVGFDLLYDKSGLYDCLRAISAGWGSARSITSNWQFLGELQPNMLNFLENHDEQRIASPWFAGRSDCMAAVGASLLFNSAPFMLYFGQEIGLDASEGHEGRTSIFSWATIPGLHRLYEFIHGEVNSLEEEELSTLSSYKRLMLLSRQPEFTSGLVYDLCYCQNGTNSADLDNQFIFIRKSADKTNKLPSRTYLLCCNFTHFGTKYSVNIPQEALVWLGLEKEGTPASIDVEVPAWGLAIVNL